MSNQFSFGIEPITCLAWNGDRTKIALSQNDNDVKIYKSSGGKWDLEHTLTEHGQRVMDIDWAPKKNLIVSCGADRNAYVWTPQSNGQWKPTLVILRIDRAAVCCKWSPLENKFAVGSGSKVISVCYFEEQNDWWVSKQIKKPIRSTVACIDWHPGNVLLAAGSTDFKTRVFSAYVKDYDEKPSGDVGWGGKYTFGNMMAEFSNGGGGWVHSVSFSHSGNQIAWVGHDSSISVVDASMGQKMVTIKTKYLPLLSLTWLSNSALVAGGNDCCPLLFSYTAGDLKFVGQAQGQKAAGKASNKAMAIFQNLDSKSASVNETELTTVHQNTISQIKIHTGDKGHCSKFISCGVDGLMVTWETKTLESAMQGLKI